MTSQRSLKALSAAPTQKSDALPVYAQAETALNALTGLTALFEKLLTELSRAPQDQVRIVDQIALVTNRLIIEHTRTSPLLTLLHENPSLFKQHPDGALDHVWALRRDWQSACSKLASLGERYLQVATAPRPVEPDIRTHLREAETRASEAESKTSRLEEWLSLLADALAYQARRSSSIRQSTLAPKADTTRVTPKPRRPSNVTKLVELIRESKLFDRSFYLSQLSQPLPLRADPLVHYVTEGWHKGLDPNPLFSVAFYSSRNMKGASLGAEPLSHYIRSGDADLLDPHPLFISAYYESRRSKPSSAGETRLASFVADIRPPSPHPLFDAQDYAKRAGLPRDHAALALLHYSVVGWRNGLPMSALFSANYYKSQWPEGAVVTEPYQHYICNGLPNGVDPHPLFDTRYYAQQRPTLSALATDPLIDFVTGGEAAGASPSPFFDPTFYRARYRPNQDLAGCFTHFLTEGGKADHRPRSNFASQAYRKAMMQGLDPADGTSAIEHFLTRGIFELTPEALSRLAAPAPITQVAKRAPPAKKDRNRTETPTASVNPALRDKLRYKQYPGKQPYLPGRPHVLIVAHAAAEFLFGSERSFIDMLEGLAHVPANIFVVLPKNAPNYTNAIRPKCQMVSVFDYGWWRRDEPPSDDSRELFADLIRSLQIDAVHCNTIMLRECLEAARACAVQSVVHVRELITQDQALVDLIGRSAEQIIAEVHAKADWIIGNSAITANIFEKPGRTFVIPNTVDIESFDIPNPVNPNRLRFGLISSNIPKKGLADVVALARLSETTCPNAEFVLIGPLTSAVSEIIQQQKDGLAPQNIIFPGYAATPKDAIAQVQVVLNFSHFAESFGRTVLEAMAAGRPVIAYEWGALPELIQHGKTGYLIPYMKPEAALPFVTELCASPARIAALGEHGRAAARERYGMDQYGGSFRRAYESIIGQQQASQPAAAPVIRAARLDNIKHVEAPARIAYFCWHFPVPSETFVLSELEVLVRSGYDVIVFCRQSPHKTFKPGFDIKHERVDSAETLARRLKETGRTIVHAHFVYPTVTDMVWPACEKAEIPFTFIAHAQDIFKHENDKRNRLAEIGASKWCRKLFTLSRFHMDYVAERGFPRDKVVINPNAVDIGRFRGATVPGREDRPNRKIVSIHRYVPKKGLSLLIRAAPLIRDLGVTIEIYGYGDCEPEYRALVAELGADNVVIGGQLNQDQVVDALRHADLFACPSVRTPEGDMDGIPTSIVESMAAGIPVLATSIAGIPDLVTDGVTGMLTDPTPEAIADGIRRFYAMPAAQVRVMIDAAHQRAAHMHDANRLVRVLTRVWENRTTDIIVVSWNNLKELRLVVDRIIANTALPYHLIICDNQSEREPVPAFLDELWQANDRVTIIHNNRNAMVGPGTNAALDQGVSDVAIYVCGKEGFSFANGWELPFIHAFDADPRTGLVGTIGRSPTYLTGAQYPNGISLFPRFRNQNFAAENPERIFGHVQGGLFAMRRAMVDEIGGFSEDVPHDYTDVEFSYYAESCGWKLAEAPGVLALFNKSRPTLSQRFDETILVAHPVLPEQVETFDQVRAGRLHHCNICDWFGRAFVPEDRGCPECGSQPPDRTLYRWLSESPYMYRRLPALNVGLHGKMDKTWAEQFQGPRLTAPEFLAQLRDSGRLKNGTGAFHLAVLRLNAEDEPAFLAMAKELRRLLKPGGVVLFQGPTPADDWRTARAPLSTTMRHAGLVPQPDLVYWSHAVQYAYTPTLAFLSP